jgi:preprotein translocase subunit Sec61beta
MSFAKTRWKGWKRKRFYERPSIESRTHMARDRDSGFHSAAGLIRYFDQEDEKALKVPPLVVVLLCIVVSGIILYLTFAYANFGMPP